MVHALFILVFVAFSYSLCTPATAAEVHSALAVVPKHGRQFHGYAVANSAKEARRVALRKCANSKCIIVRRYQTPQCVHILLGDAQIFWNANRTDIGELASVLSYCQQVDRNCHILVHGCLK
jgi:hypothetical protein